MSPQLRSIHAGVCISQPFIVVRLRDHAGSSRRFRISASADVRLKTRSILVEAEDQPGNRIPRACVTATGVLGAPPQVLHCARRTRHCGWCGRHANLPRNRELVVAHPIRPVEGARPAHQRAIQRRRRRIRKRRQADGLTSWGLRAAVGPSGSAEMTASVVSNRPATEAAFWRAERTTFVRSITRPGPNPRTRPRIGPRLPMILFEAETPCAEGHRHGAGRGAPDVTSQRDHAYLERHGPGGRSIRSSGGRSLPTGKRQGL